MFEALQAAGIEKIKIGNKEVSLEKPKTKDKIKGFGETIKVGDVFFEEVAEKFKGNHSKKDFATENLVGPYKLLAVSDDESYPWYRYMRSNGITSSPIYFFKGDRVIPQWERKFILADKENETKLNNALKYKDLYVRIYVNFNNGIPNRPVLVPACWIVWKGNFSKACRTYDYPYGLLKKKNIVKWVKNGMFTSIKMNSKVPIPEDFPIDISVETL